MIRALLIVLLAFSTTAHAVLAVTGTVAGSVARGPKTAIAKLTVSDHDVAETISIRLTVVDTGATTPRFSNADGQIKRITLYKDTFNPLLPDENKLTEKSFTAAAQVVTFDNFQIDDDTAFSLIVVIELDDNEDAGTAQTTINDFQVRYTEDGVNFDVPGAPADVKIAFFEVLVPDGTSTATACQVNGSDGSGVEMTTFALANFAANDPVNVLEQDDSLPVMVLEIKSVGADLRLKSVQVDNNYVGQEDFEEFQLNSSSEGITNAELIHLSTDDPCLLVGGVRNFANPTNHDLLGTLSGVDTDLTNNFTSSTRGLFTGDHVLDSGAGVDVTEDDSEYFLISYKLCPTCNFLDLSGDNRFIVSARVDDEAVVMQHTSTIDGIVVDIRNTTSTAPSTAGTKSFQEFVGINFNGATNTYKGLVSSLNAFSPGSRAEVFQMRLIAQGLAATMSSIDISTEDGDLEQLERIDVYTDRIMTQLVGSVTTFGDSSRVTVPLHAVNDSATAGLTLPVLSGTNTGTNLFVAVTFKTTADTGDYDFRFRAGEGTVDTATAKVIGPVNTSPNTSTQGETAVVTVSDTTVRVTSMNLSIRPAKAIEGMIYVPVLWFELNSDTQLTNQTFTISNDNDMFNAQNRGVRRVSIFKDCVSTEDCESFDSELTLAHDVLLGSAVPSASVANSASEISISGITIQSGRTQYIVAYDIGHDVNPAVNDVNAKFEGVQGQTVAGVLPAPSGGTDLEIIPNLFTIQSITAADSVGAGLTNVGAGNTTAFNFAIEVLNGFSQTVEVINVRPVAYADSLSGLDISYQFNVGADAANPGVDDTAYSETNPTSVVNGDDRRFNYDITLSELSHDGPVLMDAFISFRIPTANRVGDLAGVGNNFVSMFRYNSDTMRSAAGLAPGQIAASNKIVSFTAASSEFESPTSEHEFPSFVQSVQVIRSGQNVTFRNFHPLSAGEPLVINFVNPEQVDFVSAEIILNPGETQQVLPSSAGLSSATEPFYSIVGAGTSSGNIEIHNLVRAQNGLNTIRVQLSDISGNQLETLTLSFFMSDTILVDHFLVFPNPYNPNIQAEMEFGFSVTHQPASVKIFIVSSTGRLISELDFLPAEHATLTTSGYKLLSWDPRTRTNISGSLAPGIYIAKLVVKDGSGREVTKVAKFAVY